MYKLALIGFGVVGQGLAEILIRNRRKLLDQYGFECSVVAVSDMKKGSAYDPKGLDLEKLLELAREDKISQYPGAVSGLNAIDTILRSNADIVVEATYTNIQTGEPAYSHFKAALESGKHLVTTNKGPTALFFREISELARRKHLHFRFEGSVLSGTPALGLAEFSLAGCGIKEIRGILNGTTNFILSNMETGKSYAEALAEAQALGYAEAVPDADVEGFDAMAKVAILAKAVMGKELEISEIKREGITKITVADIESARAEGKRWKLIGRVSLEGEKVKASVAPEKLSLSDPLAGVMGAVNAITFHTELLGNVTIVGPGAGKIETGYAILADLLAIHRAISTEKRAAEAAAARALERAEKAAIGAAKKIKERGKRAKKLVREGLRKGRKAAKKAMRKTGKRATRVAKKAVATSKKTVRKSKSRARRVSKRAKRR